MNIAIICNGPGGCGRGFSKLIRIFSEEKPEGVRSREQRGKGIQRTTDNQTTDHELGAGREAQGGKRRGRRRQGRDV
jgi:hypothetical protein